MAALAAEGTTHKMSNHRIAKGAKSVGIEKLRVYPGSLALSMKALCDARGNCLASRRKSATTVELTTMDYGHFTEWGSAHLVRTVARDMLTR